MKPTLTKSKSQIMLKIVKWSLLKTWMKLNIKNMLINWTINIDKRMMNITKRLLQSLLNLKTSLNLWINVYSQYLTQTILERSLKNHLAFLRQTSDRHLIKRMISWLTKNTTKLEIKMIMINIILIVFKIKKKQKNTYRHK